MPQFSKTQAALIGQYGETLVAQWLQQQQWSILARGWTSRWGELDIVAHHKTSGIAFVEVKTRTRGNWDGDGLYAITQSKQTKLWKTAQLFLAHHDQYSQTPCRFDVALVTASKINVHAPADCNRETSITLKQDVAMEGYNLTLHTYLEAAFDLVDLG